MRTLLAELDRLGFEPKLEDGVTLRLCTCPVENLARARADVVCAAHLGMTAAIVERVGHLEVAGSEPFADGETCVLRLRALSARAQP